MFEIGEYVVFGTDGVCKVESIGPLEMEGVSKDKIYYTLAPFGKTGNGKIFAPVDSKRVVIRRVITSDEAEALIAEIRNIAPLSIPNEKKREETYRQVLQSCDCSAMVGLMKEIYQRKKLRIAQGKKLPSVDERYFTLAENSLYSELSLPLKLEKNSIRDYITDAVDSAG